MASGKLLPHKKTNVHHNMNEKTFAKALTSRLNYYFGYTEPRRERTRREPTCKFCRRSRAVHGLHSRRRNCCDACLTIQLEREAQGK
jgi:hypothetical protein